MFRRRTATVQLGERFVKAGDPPGRAWRVIRLWSTAVGIPHAQIEATGDHKERRIISISALTDHNFFGPLPAGT